MLKLLRILNNYVPNSQILRDDTRMIDCVQDIYSQCLEFIRYLNEYAVYNVKRVEGYYNILDEVPRVGEGQIFIKVNNDLLASFGLNDVEGQVIDIAIPTKVSDLNNDEDYISEEDLISALTSYVTKTTLASDYYDKEEIEYLIKDFITIESVPTKVSQLENDSGYLTEHQDISGKANVGDCYTKQESDNKYLTEHQDISGKVDRSELATVATTGDYDDLLNLPTIPTIPANISYFNNDAGYLVLSDISNKADKATSLSGYGILDAKIENGVITLGSNTITPLTQHQDISGKANTADLGTVAFSNDYDDLDNKPTIPVVPTLAEVATSGDYDDLNNKPVYALGESVGGPAAKAVSIPYGECDNTSTATAFTASVPGITELRDGVCVLLKNGVITSASGFTININNLGAKPVYSSMAAGNPVTPTNPTRETTTFNINYVVLLIYHSTLISGGCWIFYRGYYYDTNSLAYQIRTSNSIKKTTDAFRYYKILFSSADDTKWIPACASTVNSATSAKTVNQRPINPFGRIVYAYSTTNYAANANIAAQTIWDRYNVMFGYSFNRTGAALTLTVDAPVYIKCSPQEDGSAIIDADTPYVQALPTVQDGKIYIYLGMASSATQVELDIYHPIYYYLKEYRGTNYIKRWHGERIKPTIVLEIGTEMIDYSPDAKEGFDNFFDVDVAAYRPNPLEYFNIYFINGFNYADDAYINVSWIRVNTQTKSLYVYNIKENYYYRIYSTTNALNVEYEDA